MRYGKENDLSYKILESVHGVSDAVSDGVVRGVFDECGVSSVGRRIFLAKGKIVIAGVSVLFDGREVIALPEDYGDGRYSLIGVLKVQQGKPYDFYLSVREGEEVTRDPLDCDNGVVECKIAEIAIGGGKVNVKRTLPLVDTVENSKKSYENSSQKGFEAGRKLTILDAKDGVFSEFSILGDKLYEGGKYKGVSAFNVVSHTGNLFNLDGLDIRDLDGDDGNGIYIAPSYIWGVVQRRGNGIEVYGQDSLSDERERGLLTIRLGDFEPGNYYLDFSALAPYIFTFMEEEKCVGVKVYLDGEEIKSINSEHFSTNSDAISVKVPFSIAQKGVLVIKIFIHGHNLYLSDFCLSRGSDIAYVDYGYQKTHVEIKDIYGNTHELMSTGYAHDEVTREGGQYVIIKRTETSDKPQSVKTRKRAYFINENSSGLSTYDGGMGHALGNILYERINYERIPLAPECAKVLDTIRTYSGKTIVECVDTQVNPVFRVRYSKE